MRANPACQFKLPVVAAADEPLAFDITVRQAAAIVGANIVDNIKLATGTAHHGNVALTIARGCNAGAREVLGRLLYGRAGRWRKRSVWILRIKHAA